MGLFWKIKESLISPNELFENVKNESISYAVKYFLVISLIPISITIILTIMFGVLSTYIGSIIRVTSGSLGTLPFIFTGLLGMFLETLGMPIYIMYLAWILTMFVYLLVGIFVFAGLLHIFVYIFGGRNGYANTFKVAVYGSTPMILFLWTYALLGALMSISVASLQTVWLPVIFYFVIFGLWSLFIEIAGVTKLHEIPRKKAIIAVLVSTLIIVVLFMPKPW